MTRGNTHGLAPLPDIFIIRARAHSHTLLSRAHMPIPPPLLSAASPRLALPSPHCPLPALRASRSFQPRTRALPIVTIKGMRPVPSLLKVASAEVALRFKVLPLNEMKNLSIKIFVGLQLKSVHRFEVRRFVKEFVEANLGAPPNPISERGLWSRPRSRARLGAFLRTTRI